MNRFFEGEVELVAGDNARAAEACRDALERLTGMGASANTAYLAALVAEALYRDGHF